MQFLNDLINSLVTRFRNFSEVWCPKGVKKRDRQRTDTYGIKGKETGSKLLVAYESSTQYQPNFDFYGIGERSVRTNISKEMDKAIARVLPSVKWVVNQVLNLLDKCFYY